MRFEVTHVTDYRYSAPVRLGRQLLRLTPRDEGQGALWSEITAGPAPSAREVARDSYGNTLTALEFSGETAQLRIESRFRVEVPVPDPLRQELPPLPWATAPEQAAFLGPVAEPVRAFSQDLGAGAGGDAARFLDALNRWLFENIDRHIRDRGAAHDPVHLLADRNGACRDISRLFIAAARGQGMPARFVSGYQARAETPDGRRHLHAWAEIWLPGTGWRGFDATHGVPVTDGHVALAVAPDQDETMQLEGGFWGEGVQSTMGYEITIRTGA